MNKFVEERKDEIETLLALDTGNAIRTQAKPETAASMAFFSSSVILSP